MSITSSASPSPSGAPTLSASGAPSSSRYSEKSGEPSDWKGEPPPVVVFWSPVRDGAIFGAGRDILRTAMFASVADLMPSQLPPPRRSIALRLRSSESSSATFDASSRSWRSESIVVKFATLP